MKHHLYGVSRPSPHPGPVMGTRFVDSEPCDLTASASID